MIKLFWNTHNQQKTITDDKNIKKQDSIDYKWGIYHKKNSDIWIYEILQKIKYDVIDSEKNLEKGDILIIVDSNPEKKIELYNKLKLICSKILLFHLGDEEDSSLGDFIEDQNALQPLDASIRSNLGESTTKILATLTPREERVLRMRFGIGMNTDHTLEEVGLQFSVTRERIRQIEAKALRKLKHPSRSKQLKSFLES